jgi:hypothetical protein
VTNANRKDNYKISLKRYPLKLHLGIIRIKVHILVQVGKAVKVKQSRYRPGVAQKVPGI